MLRWGSGLAVLGGVAVAAWLALQPEPVPVDVAEVARGPMRVTVDEEGRTRIRERYVVSSPLPGRTARITLDPGDPVTAGETVLAVIDPRAPSLLDPRERAAAEARVRAAEAALRRAGAALEQARASYDFAENELARVREAAAAGAAVAREIDAAESDLRETREAFRGARFAEEIARFELEQARAALAFSGGSVAGAEGVEGAAGAEGAAGGIDGAAAADPGSPGDDPEDRLVIRSPIDGAVLRVMQESAAVVAPGTPLLEIGDPSDLELVIDVLSADAVRIEPGAEVIVEAWGGPEALAAIVRTVEPSAFTEISALGIEEQRVNVVADLRSPAAERAALGDGYRVEARIVTWESEDVVQVPTGAVFRPVGGVEEAGRDRGWAVYVVEDGRARRRAVALGRRTWRTAQVVGGLEPGDRVVVHPSDRLADGVPVRVRGGE